MCLCGCSNSTDTSEAPSVPSPKGRGGSFSGAQMKALQELEADLSEVDRSTWADELLARRYEGVVNDVWDQIIDGEDPWRVLQGMTFRSVSFGEPGPADVLQHGIHRFRIQESEEPRSLTEWRLKLKAWANRGWEIEFQSCRLSSVDLANRAFPSSVFDLVVHLVNHSTNRRGILRGELIVDWGGDDGNQGPEMAAVGLRNARWLTREGPLVFQEIVSREMMPHTETRFIDPLIVADFDGNGRSDLLFSGANVLYSGIQGGGLQSGAFVKGSSPVVYTSVYADIDGDGWRDYVIVDRKGVLVMRGGDGLSLIHI